jgi:gamma-glutamyl:cysteine ligase YbdK (ATP-grasp superfamily)
MKLRIGIEEEVFIIEGERPAVDALYPLFKLLRKNPAFYYMHTAANLPRGKDFLESPVASIEISTPVTSSVDEAVKQLSLIRKELARNCPSRIVALGMLPDLTQARSIVSGLHIHLSGSFDLVEARKKIACYLPALLLITANSPSVENDYLSNRILLNPFSGAIVNDSFERFQDIIISRRLNTLEIRIFDPVSDLKRIEVLLRCLEAIIRAPAKRELDVKNYIRIRNKAAKRGIMNDEVKRLAEEVVEISGVDFKFFLVTESHRVKKMLEELTLKEVYEVLDRDYRAGVLYEGKNVPKALRTLYGFLGYYIPKMPYTTYKFLKEHGYL